MIHMLILGNQTIDQKNEVKNIKLKFPYLFVLNNFFILKYLYIYKRE